MSTKSLVLQRVTKEAVGEYVCRAVNSEGVGESNPVPLKIMCESVIPICDSKILRYIFMLLLFPTQAVKV